MTDNPYRSQRLTYRHPLPFRLESGETLEGLEIAYHVYGPLPSPSGRVAWVCHALTADSDVAGWWPHTVERDCFLDPERQTVVCANILGSCYGTTGPSSISPRTGAPYLRDFPRLTMRDIVGAHRLLADHLGVGRIHTVVGSSMGGFQALEWAVMEPERFDRHILIATSPKATPWQIALNETQRMAIEADPTFGRSAEGGKAGLAAARAIGLVSYRGPEGYNLSQQNHAGQGPEEDPFSQHRACSYQRHQGKKLVDRFDACSYMAILDAFDTHDVGRGRGGVPKALSRLKGRSTVIGLSTDLVFTPGEMRRLARLLPNAEYREISSPFGHDGFLVEHAQLNALLAEPGPARG